MSSTTSTRSRSCSWAAADLGSNAFRLLVAEEVAPGVMATREFLQEFVRLGERLRPGATFAPEATVRAECALSRFRARMDDWGANRRVAALTAAGRMAEGGAEFRARASQLLAAEVRILAPAQEARLSASGALSVLEVGPREVLFLDIGGGSTEVVSLRAGRPTAVASLPVGAVQLYEASGLCNEPEARPRPEQLDRLDALIKSALEPLEERFPGDEWSRSLGDGRALVVAAGGTPLTVAAHALGLSTAVPRRLRGASVSARELILVWEELAVLSAPERLALGSVERGREDVIVAGLAILREFLRRFGNPSFTASDGGLPEGLLLAEVAGRRGAATWDDG